MFWGSLNMGAFTSFNHTGGGALKISTILKGGRETFYPVLREGLQKVAAPRFFLFLAPPPSPSR